MSKAVLSSEDDRTNGRKVEALAGFMSALEDALNRSSQRFYEVHRVRLSQVRVLASSAGRDKSEMTDDTKA